MFRILKIDGPDGGYVYIVYDVVSKKDIASYGTLEEAYKDLISRRL